MKKDRNLEVIQTVWPMRALSHEGPLHSIKMNPRSRISCGSESIEQHLQDSPAFLQMVMKPEKPD